MNKNSLPAAVRQIIDSLFDPTTMQHVRFNNEIILENIRDCSDEALKRYRSKKKK